MHDLKGKAAVITGAASGIGRSTAKLLATHGVQLLMCDVDEAGLASLRDELGSSCLLSRRVDVSDRAAMQVFSEQVHALIPAVDVLVNNAGVGLQGGLLATSLDDWEWILKINLGGVIHGCHFFVPKMVERACGGQVVNVASVLGVFAAPDVIGYATAKFAVVGLSESLRSELSPHGIGVSTICPGMIDTGIIAATRFANGHGEAETRRGKLQQLYKKRSYSPDRVAETILDAIRKDRALVPVALEAWALYYLKRFAPALSQPLGRMMSRRLL